MLRRVLLCLVCLVGSTAGPGVAQDSSVFVLPERTPAPAFTLPDLSGRPVSSAAFGGKIVILSFGATWCTTCTGELDRKSTRLNSSHGYISYAVFCLKKKKNKA